MGMNLCASAVAVLIFALAIAAASNPWYYYSQQFVEKTQSTGGTIQLVSQTVNSSTVDYDLDGFTQTNEVNGAITVTAYQYSQRGNMPLSLVLLIVVALNKFPMPIDSDATSGEAL